MADAGLPARILKAYKATPRVWLMRVPLGRSTGRQQMAPAGTPDVLGVIAGSSVAFEAKTKTGKLSAVQIAQHKRLRNSGCLVYTVTDIRQVDAIVRDLMLSEHPTYCECDRCLHGEGKVNK